MDEAVKNEILKILKVEGLVVAEDMAVKGVRAAFAIMALVVPKVSFGLGSIIVPMLGAIERPVLSLLDEIDGKDNPDY